MMTKTIHVNIPEARNHSYDIIIGINLKTAVLDIKTRFPRNQKFVITDKNVADIYRHIFDSHDFKIITLPSGEKSKTRKFMHQLEDILLTSNINRDSLIIALGGGVIGDLAGFVAATLLRGIPYVQIPTSLLAQVDSSIGGKVAINHPIGKNLIGSFYQPKIVYIDPLVLKTLPDREFRNGMAEVIKYGIILDKLLFSYLLTNHKNLMKLKPSSLIHVIRRCCEIKKNIVQMDEKEHGLRRILNFGHTIGHSIELLSGFKISHGKAVAMGMVAEAKISVLMGLLADDEFTRIVNLLKLYQLPTNLPSSIDLKQIVHATLTDKKVHHGEVQYTLLCKTGKAIAGVSLSDRAVIKFISA